MKTAIKHHKNPLNAKDIDRLENLVVVAPEDGLPQFAYSELLERRRKKLGVKAPAEILTAELPNKPGTRVSYAKCKPDIPSFDLLTLARKLAAAQLQTNPAAVTLYTPDLAPPLAARVMEALIAALLAANHPLPDFKSKKEERPGLRTLHLYGCEEKPDLTRTLAEAEGNNLARELTALPTNELTPGRYRARIAELAKAHGWRMQFLDLDTLKRKKAGAFLAVARSSARRDDGIVRLSYTPKAAKRQRPLALVGKGICFDTGGANLKPAKHMLGMHEDMAGSAVALGTLLALTELKVDFPVHCWLALAENLIGPQAYMQNEVVTACNGTTIEVVHTDAEGRMVLADTLALASRERPGMIVDYATLTGACIYALGTRYSGAFTNREDLIPDIIRAGADSGERVWPFPADPDYDQALESEIADIKQCTLEGEADHILAARFLSRFIGEKIPWLHIDLASASHKGGLAHIPSATTGFGVRFSLNLLLDKQLSFKLKASS